MENILIYKDVWSNVCKNATQIYASHLQRVIILEYLVRISLNFMGCFSVELHSLKG